ncbi:MAG: hypothetical protein KatS3mg107_0192 [Gemmataceae bacterium]|nr:MAG: hypothetical protein KatS3mg107_0192 [Gemmataceae bacterium]
MPSSQFQEPDKQELEVHFLIKLVGYGGVFSELWRVIGVIVYSSGKEGDTSSPPRAR